MDKVKSLLINTRIYKGLLTIRSVVQIFFIKYLFRESASLNSTVYCISPYKTGTTYFSGLFNCRSSHEPLMHATIRNINDMDFLERRRKFLDLDLECSGFFADKLELVRRFAPDSKIVFLIRNPESWIGSVVNYFEKLDKKVSYNYVARMIFDPICRYPVEKFYYLNKSEQTFVIESLLTYWIEVYGQAISSENCLVVELDNIDECVEEIECFTGFKATNSQSVWKRENKNKKRFELADYIDVSKFSRQVKELGYDL